MFIRENFVRGRRIILIKIILFFGVLLTGLSLYSRAVFAFTITPAKATYFIEPGASASGILKIINDGNISKKYRLSLVGAKSSDKGYPEFGLNFDAAEQWIKLTSATITAGPVQEVAVPYIIDVPARFAPGAHYAGIVVDEEPSGQSTVGVRERLIKLIYIQVAGIAREELAASVGIPTPDYPFTKSRVWPATLNNLGNIPVALKAQVKITDFKGRAVYLNKPAVGGELIPGAVRNLKIPLSFNQVKFPGFYRVNLTIKYGNGQNLISKNTTIFYSPVWSTILISLIIIVVIIIFIFYLKKRSSNKII